MEILVSSRFNTLWSKEEFHLTSKASMQLWYKLGLEGSLGMQHRILGYLWPIREYLDNNQACYGISLKPILVKASLGIT